MAVSSVRDVIAAFDEGRFRLGQQVRKVTAASWTNGHWFDSTMFAGQPLPSYYASAPLAFAPMSRSTHGGWDHGDNVAPATKHIKRVAMLYLSTSFGGQLVDVLGYYPFVDEGTVGEEQVCDNTLALTDRHGSGDGVRAYAVAVAPSGLVAGHTITLTYTNSDGVTGRVSPSVPLAAVAAAAVNGCIVSGGLGRPPFFPLQGSDRGIQRIESIRVDGPGDVGLFTVVLCRPICLLPPSPGLTNGDLAPRCYVESDFLRGPARLPVIADDAFVTALGLNYNSGSTTNSLGTLFFDFDVFWR